MSSNIINLNKTIDQFSISNVHQCNPENCHSFIDKPQYYLKILTQNIRSINTNFDNFQTLLERTSLDCDIIVLNECWLPCATNANIPTLPNYKSLSTTKHINQSDGVVVYIKSNLSFTVEEPDLQNSASGLLIKLDTNISIFCIYRSPSNNNINTFLNSFNSILSSLSSSKTVIVTGDINIDITPSSLDTRSHEYLNSIAFHGFLPAHQLPTRNNSCLDHTLLRTKCSSETFIFPSTITDHTSTMICLETKTSRHNAIRKIQKIDYEALDLDIKNLDLQPILKNSDPENATNCLIVNLTNIIEKNTTVKILPKRNRILKPWITPGLLKCMRNRDHLHKKLKQSPDDEILKVTYTRYRNFCTKILKKVKRQHDAFEIKKAGKNSKLLWETIKKSTNSTKEQHSPTHLLSSSLTAIQSCNGVNSFFANIGKELAEKIQSPSAISNSIQSTATTTSSFALLDTDNDEVESAIKSIRHNAATGWDCISATILKRYSKTLTPILCHIFNLCFHTGVFPNSFKKAIIHPIFKGGDPKAVTNYRPIAVLTAMSKILERILNNRLVNYLESNNLLSKQQYGFRKHRSTTDATLALINELVHHLNNRKKTLTIFLDLAKAFDTVPIPTLLLKLQSLGVRGTQLNLFQSYLTDRSQIVKINDHLSTEQSISYGVPQGSILGPTLFLVFINDLCKLELQNGFITSYADDTAITFSANSWTELQSVTQIGFNYVYNWLLSHSLTLNTSKTKLITFSLRSNSQPTIPISIKAHTCSSQPQTVSLNTECICPVIASTDTIKYLGIILDKYLNFKAHIDHLTSRVRKLIHFFKTLRHITNPHIIRTVYYAMCQSIISYCITIWGGACKTYIKPLEIAQRAILKVATFRPFLFPTFQLYQLCKVLSVRQLFILNTTLIQHTRTPHTISNTRRKDRICTLPTPNFTFTKRFFLYLGPYLYNKVNKYKTVYNLNSIETKHIVTNLLLKLNYDETESFIDNFIEL